jgi:hypothetical protein
MIPVDDGAAAVDKLYGHGRELVSTDKSKTGRLRNSQKIPRLSKGYCPIIHRELTCCVTFKRSQRGCRDRPHYTVFAFR